MASSGERRAGRTVKRGEIGELNARPCYDRETGTQKCKQFGANFCKNRLPGGSDEHQWIQQRLAYKMGKCEKVLLRYMGVIEFKTLIVPRAIGNPRR